MQVAVSRVLCVGLRDARKVARAAWSKPMCRALTGACARVRAASRAVRPPHARVRRQRFSPDSAFAPCLRLLKRRGDELAELLEQNLLRAGPGRVVVKFPETRPFAELHRARSPHPGVRCYMRA